MSVQNLGKVVGNSAYEIAVQQGYVGTESEWIASLHGADGTNGVNGEDGFSPLAEVVKTGSVATITITDKNGTTTASIYDGSGASLVAGTGIDITGDTITNTMPYDDAATASYIFNNFGMSVTTTSTLETATAPISEGSATVSLFWNRWSKPELSVYVDDTLTDTIEAEDWVYDSQTDYNTASLTGGGSISWVQVDQHFLLSGLSGSEVKIEYVGTAIVRTPLDDLYIDNTIARASDIPTPDGTTITSSNGVWSATFTESDPVFSASPAATITASDISNWNSLEGVPTATASDEGKALVVTDSAGSIGWDTVGGGGSSYTASTGIDITNDVISVDNTICRVVKPVGSFEIATIGNWSANAKTEVSSYIRNGVPHILAVGSNGAYTYYQYLYSTKPTGLFYYGYYIERFNYQNKSRMLEVKASSSTVTAVTATLLADFPANPASDGTYFLVNTVSSGVATQSWEFGTDTFTTLTAESINAGNAEPADPQMDDEYYNLSLYDSVVEGHDYKYDENSTWQNPRSFSLGTSGVLFEDEDSGNIAGLSIEDGLTLNEAKLYYDSNEAKLLVDISGTIYEVSLTPYNPL